MKQQITVLCGSGYGASPVYAEAAAELGALMGKQGRQLIFGGCALGLMKVVSDSVRLAGGHVTACVIAGNPDPIDLHEGDTLRTYPDYFARKQGLYTLPGGLIALPGGMGTLAEVCDLFAQRQLLLTREPLVLLNMQGFYDPLLSLLDHMTSQGFFSPAHRSMVLYANTPGEALGLLDEA